MKIIISAGFAPSLLNFRRELLDSMVAAGHEVVALAPSVEDAVRGELEGMGVRAISINLDRTGRNPFRDLLLVNQLIERFREERPDVVFNYTVKPVIYGSLAASRAGVPRIVSMITGLGYSFARENWTQRVLGLGIKWLYKKALDKNRCVFFQNPDDLQLFRQAGILGSDAKATLVKGSGVNVEQFRVSPAPLKPLTFTMIARLYREKGIFEFVEAARLVKKDHPECRFVVAGGLDSNPTSLTTRQLDLWKAEGSVEFVGWLKDVRPLLNQTSVYVLPSYREGTPRTVLEAMATGRAVVTTDAPGCRETVQDGENGFLVPIKDSKALVAAFERIIASPALCVQMGNKSREIAEELFDVREVNRVMLEAICGPES